MPDGLSFAHGRQASTDQSILFDIIYIHVDSPHDTARRKPAPRRRKLWRISDAEFRDLRLGCLLSQRACAEFLGVAVRAWDRGRVRVALVGRPAAASASLR